MSLTYSFVKTFKGANMAICCDMPCGADYPYPDFDILEVRGKLVKLKNRWKPNIFELPIHRGSYVTEYVWVGQSSAFENIFNCKPTKFRVCPIQGAMK